MANIKDVVHAPLWVSWEELQRAIALRQWQYVGLTIRRARFTRDSTECHVLEQRHRTQSSPVLHQGTDRIGVFTTARSRPGPTPDGQSTLRGWPASPGVACMHNTHTTNTGQVRGRLASASSMVKKVN